MTVVRKAGAFSVWGAPSKAILAGMKPRQIKLLKDHISGVAGGAYTMGFDNGVDEAFQLVSETVSDKWQKKRAKSRRL